MINHTYKYRILSLLLVMLMALVFSACSTPRKSGRNKNCDCPRWSMYDITNPTTHEKV